MRAIENERRDSVVIALILLVGLLCILFATRWALRFTPRWELDANMESLLDPNSDFLTRRPGGFIEPVDPAILTNPAWINDFLTPGASFSTGTPLPATAGTSFLTSMTDTLVPTQTAVPATIAFATNTALVLPSPTNTFIYFPPPPTSTPKSNPVPTSTSIITSTSTSTATSTATPTPTSASTATPTSTPTSTSTFTAIPTSPACTTTITITGASGSYAKPGGSTCFEYTDLTLVNGGIFQLTSTGVVGMVSGSGCPGKSIPDGSTISYGAAQSGGLMTFRITGLAGTVDINISDWTTYPACP